MNTINLVRDLLEQKDSKELNQYLSTVWNQVWSGDSRLNYANLRLFKAVDKIKRISGMGVDFRNKHVLDIGCGNGTTLLYLRKYFDVKGVGIDISDQAVKELQSNIKNKNLSFYVGDHRDLRGMANN